MKKMEKELFIKALNEETEKMAIFLKVPLANEVSNMPTVTIREEQDIQQAIQVATNSNEIIVDFEGSDVIIPLENLIASLEKTSKLLVKVKNFKEAKIALEVLEIGSNGVILETGNPGEVEKLLSFVSEKEDMTLQEAEVITVKQLGMGTRVCIDTSDIMKEGEGLLVGTSSQSMILVQSEVAENKYVASRPFRVNAGTVALYTLQPNEKTNYLAELSAGSSVLIVNREGKVRESIVSRCKIEKRPLILIEAIIGEKIAKVLLQNAETIRLVQKSGSVAVTDIKIGDKILAKIDETARHFGMAIEGEQIIEK